MNPDKVFESSLLPLSTGSDLVLFIEDKAAYYSLIENANGRVPTHNIILTRGGNYVNY